ncbi:MAG: KpsF/GutQ family sugar-phosphate isomerase [Bacteroidales bacterium]|nr:KpsF/GutQ family sugar-phosphate isomerase [Bacteroidales bacterium]MDD4216730.1 KpsF/GutQ family sugar-phosphate isomerase [Bacteroidales bacterium]MDY0140425.1 KpsF/GutQ family sugar-phosphate isomerase [Bacteroidales bacterium]
MLDLTTQKIIETGKRTIAAEAKAVSKLVDYIDESFANIVHAISESKGRLIVTGIGKSANIAMKIVASLNSTGTPSIFMHAADAIHGDLGIVQTDDIVMCISKSGNTPEIKVLIPLIKNNGNIIIALVSDINSFLAKSADYILRASVDAEACPNNLAPTSSTTAQLVIGDALTIALLENRGFTSTDFAKFHPGGSLGKKLYLKVDDIIKLNETPKVYENDGLTNIITEITSKRLGATAVVNNNNEVIGIITDGDLRRMLAKFGNDITNLTACKIMSANPKTIQTGELAVNALRIIRQNNITQVIVTEKNIYVGMVHLHDLMREGIV